MFFFLGSEFCLVGWRWIKLCICRKLVAAGDSLISFNMNGQAMDV